MARAEHERELALGAVQREEHEPSRRVVLILELTPLSLLPDLEKRETQI